MKFEGINTAIEFDETGRLEDEMEEKETEEYKAKAEELESDIYNAIDAILDMKLQKADMNVVEKIDWKQLAYDISDMVEAYEY